MNTTKQVGVTGAVSFLTRRNMPAADAHLFVSYLSTGLVSEVALSAGRYRITALPADHVPAPQFEISVRPYTVAEREAEAIAKHVCPVGSCGAGATRWCKWPTGRLLKHPHPERVRKVKDEQP